MRWAATMLLLLGALAPSAAGAQDAEALVAEGLALRREGRDAEAAERFRAAYAIDGSGRSLAQVALAEQATGEWVAAERDLVAALAMDDAWIAEHRAALETALGTIRTHLGRLSVVSPVEGAEIWIDGQRAATLPLLEPIAAPVGTLVVEVRAPGYVTVQRSATIRAGELSRVSVDLVAEPREATARVEPEPTLDEPVVHEPPPPPSGTSPLLVIGLSGLGAAALSVAGAVIAGAMREDIVVNQWNVEARCPGPERLESCPDEYAAWRTAEDWAIGLGVASGVLAAASAVLVAIGASERAAPPVALSVGPSGAHASVSIRY